jgi:transcription-repair coupling factor (superfamily II helicase)
LSRMDDVRKLGDLRQELVDRFGTIPEPTQRLLEVAELRIDATLWSIKSISIEEQFLALGFADKNRVEQLARKHGNKLRVLDHQKAYWPLGDSNQSPLEIAKQLFA